VGVWAHGFDGGDSGGISAWQSSAQEAHFADVPGAEGRIMAFFQTGSRPQTGGHQWYRRSSPRPRSTTGIAHQWRGGLLDSTRPAEPYPICRGERKLLPVIRPRRGI